MVLELKGDIRETPILSIAHGVNCQGAMGSGVARALFQKWPEVRTEYLKFYAEAKEEGAKPEDFLGCTNKVVTDRKYIYNMFTQLEFGPADKQYVDYSAILKCFDDLRYEMPRAIAVPKIGAGLAGGDWKVIRDILVKTTQKLGIDLVIYSLTDDKK